MSGHHYASNFYMLDRPLVKNKQLPPLPERKDAPPAPNGEEEETTRRMIKTTQYNAAEIKTNSLSTTDTGRPTQRVTTRDISLTLDSSLPPLLPKSTLCSTKPPTATRPPTRRKALAIMHTPPTSRGEGPALQSIEMDQRQLTRQRLARRKTPPGSDQPIAIPTHFDSPTGIFTRGRSLGRVADIVPTRPDAPTPSLEFLQQEHAKQSTEQAIQSSSRPSKSTRLPTPAKRSPSPLNLGERAPTPIHNNNPRKLRS